MAKQWHVYLLRCADGSLYCGVSNDVARRLGAHNAGKGARYTRSRLPVTLVWRARAKDRSAALRRERKIKALSREQKLRLLSAKKKGGPT